VKGNKIIQKLPLRGFFLLGNLKEGKDYGDITQRENKQRGVLGLWAKV
jgi:hypothetical protein